MPQNVTAFKVTPPSGIDCIIVVNWNPPINADASLIEQYMVESPSGNHTTTTTKIAVALFIHHCEVGANTYIKIHAIDSCGRNGVSSDDNITDLIRVANNSLEGVTTQQIPTTDVQSKFNNGVWSSSRNIGKLYTKH